MVGFVPLNSSFSSGPAVLRSLTLVKSSVLAKPASADAAKSRVCRLPAERYKFDNPKFWQNNFYAGDFFYDFAAIFNNLLFQF